MNNGDQESHAQNMARAAELEQRKTRIQQLNDRFRTTMLGGRWLTTSGIRELGPLAMGAIVEQVRAFNAFTPDNDPYEEHDFGSVVWAGQTIFWKIDCYDRALEYGSPDPSNPDVTARVMTIMLASEY